MTLTFKTGDMFKEPAEAIVNTVNCVGVMGKGVALEFKRRWPANFTAYKRMCDRRALRPGQVFVYQNTDMLDGEGPRYLINFPTKDHWRSKSRLEFVERGLDDFVAQIVSLKIKSVVMPPLGCGNGGLNWIDVKQVIVEKLAPVPDVDFVVFEPAPTSARTVSLRTTMNFERAVLLKAFGDFEVYFGGSLTRITMQKIVYFLQEAGVGFGLKFEPNEFGPYSEALKDAFRILEEHDLIVGFSGDDPEVTVSDKGRALANDYLVGECRDEAESIIQRVSLLVDGFESPYGMELLSSVHFLAKQGSADASAVVDGIKSWSVSKAEKYDAAVIGLAFERLVEDRLLH